MPKFTLRKDWNGFRPIFFLGSESGKCPVECRFCNVGVSKKISSKENIQQFNKQNSKYLKLINGFYHPVVYNRGNITNTKEFSKKTLNYILNSFNRDNRIKFVSINSREQFATLDVLEYLSNKKLNYPIHFILGIESFSENTTKSLGKNTVGELQRFVNKLNPYNRENSESKKGYIFGLDVNLLFLPELYLVKEETRKNYFKIKEGIKNDLEEILKYKQFNVPIEINIHPFSCVETLPYKDADLDLLMKIIPKLQKTVDKYNKTSDSYETHLFLGVEGKGYETSHQKKQIQKWKSSINKFNETGKLEIDG